MSSMRRPAPASFAQLCRGLHQDAVLEADDLAKLVALAARGVPPDQHAELSDFLRSTLERSTAAELKGLLNRASPDVHFTSRGAADFLAAVVTALQSEGGR
jgi:hypothetical protein